MMTRTTPATMNECSALLVPARNVSSFLNSARSCGLEHDGSLEMSPTLHVSRVAELPPAPTAKPRGACFRPVFV